MTAQPHNDLSAMGGKDYGKDYGSQPLPLPAGDELVEILDEIYQDKNTLGDFPIDRETAKSLLNAYILAQVLELIGEDAFPSNEDPDAYSQNFLRAQLRQAATARFGGGKGTQ